jgi:hypothetical protein
VAGHESLSGMTSELLRGRSIGPLQPAIMALRTGGTTTDPGDHDFGKIRCPAYSNVEFVPGNSDLGSFYPAKSSFLSLIRSTSFAAGRTLMGLPSLRPHLDPS